MLDAEFIRYGAVEFPENLGTCDENVDDAQNTPSLVAFNFNCWYLSDREISSPDVYKKKGLCFD